MGAAAVDAGTVVSDIVNAVTDYCGDGFDAVEDCMRGEILAAGGDAGEEALAPVHACLEGMYARLLADIDETFEVFGAAVHERFLHVPVEMLLPTTAGGEGASPGTPGEGAAAGGARGEADEVELDASLKDLRCRIATVRSSAAARARPATSVRR